MNEDGDLSRSSWLRPLGGLLKSSCRTANGVPVKQVFENLDVTRLADVPFQHNSRARYQLRYSNEAYCYLCSWITFNHADHACFKKSTR